LGRYSGHTQYLMGVTGDPRPGGYEDKVGMDIENCFNGWEGGGGALRTRVVGWKNRKEEGPTPESGPYSRGRKMRERRNGETRKTKRGGLKDRTESGTPKPLKTTTRTKKKKKKLTCLMVDVEGFCP